MSLQNIVVTLTWRNKFNNCYISHQNIINSTHLWNQHMKVSHSNTLWLGYKLYSSFVLHGRITLLPLPTLPLGRHHSLQHPCYHYLADSCITYEPYTVLLIGKVFGGITDQHSESGCFVFLSQVFVLSPFFHFFYLSFSPSLFSIPFVLSFIFYSFHSLFLGLSLVHSVFPRPLHPLFILTFSLSPLSFICSFFSVSRFVLSLIFHLFFLSPFFCLFFLTFFCSFFHWFCLLFFLSDFLSICSFFIHSFFFSLSLPFFLSHSLSFVLSFLPSFVVSFLWSFSPINSFIILLPILLVLPFICSFFRPFILLFFRPFIPSPSPFLSFILSFSLLPRAFLCSFIHSFIHSFILSLLDR